MSNGLPSEFTVTIIGMALGQNCEPIPAETTPDGVQGGLLCTGFFDVEKLIQKVEPPDLAGQREVRTWFLDKKLPYQLLLLRLPNQVVSPGPPPPPPPANEVKRPWEEKSAE